MRKNKNFYAVIMAGGTGTRLWPTSRKEKPKQFQKFTSGRTMIRETYARVAKIVLAKNIMISTTEQYRKLALKQLPDISPKQLIIEPAARGTAPAIALVAKSIYQLNPKAVVATIASDHVIGNVPEFVAAVSAGMDAAARNPAKLVTVGINPTFPDTGLGYIKMGKLFRKIGGKEVFQVDAFVEKPDKKNAERYLRTGAYLWNASYFIFSAAGFLETAKKFIPDISQALGKMQQAKNKQAALKIYHSLKNEPIDTALVEKMGTGSRLVVPSKLIWSDVGNWGALHDFFRNNQGSSMIVRGKHIDEKSKDCLVYSHNKMIATLGLESLIIVETEDVILVANKNSAAEVKKIIDKLKEQGKDLYL